MRKCFIALFTLLSLVFVSQAHAHYLWLNVSDYNPEPDEEIAISIGWGHKFPEDGQPREEMVKKMKLFLVEPDGKKVPLRIEFKEGKGVKPIKIRLKKKGVYLAVLTIKTFVSKTTEGYFYKPKDELKDVIMSKWSETTATAVISVGHNDKVAIKELKECKYQILPLKDPAMIEKGQVLPVKVIFEGKPFRTWVYATYTGFSEFKDTFAWTTRTDKKGIAKIKILKSGKWLVKTDTHIPFSDPKKADEAYFISTLTFGI